MPALRLLQITDTHLEGDAHAQQRGIQTLAALRAVLAEALQQPADALLLTGDVTNDDPAGYRWIREELGRCGRAVLCIPGNHDDPAAMRRALPSEPFHHCGHHDFGHGDFGHGDFGGWRIVMLDSCLFGHTEGVLAATELLRLDRTLAEAPTRHALLVLHHPPVAMGSRWLDDLGLVNSDDFFEIVDRHANVRGILWGHAHQEFSSVRENAHGKIPLLACPSTCIQFLPGAADFALDTRPPGFRKLALQDDGRIDSEVVWVG